MKRLTLVQFNEVNFPLLFKYAQKYDFKNLKEISNLDQFQTFSEDKYELLEPWIQWASFNTGLTYEDHKIFRLGDVKSSNVEQVFEKIEKLGFKVGAISPMNAENRLSSPSFFIPDPWTLTRTDGSLASRQLYQVLRQTVNDNAAGRITFLSYCLLLINFIRFSSFRNLGLYCELILKSRKRKWCKALFLDLFLSDLHNKLSVQKKPNFTTLFLNGFAHIQHHYLTNSEFILGSKELPSWYLPKNVDPLLDAAIVYNRIFGALLNQDKNSSVIIATGLSQEPHEYPDFYYRLKDHENFLKKLGVLFSEVRPRMTRDFEVVFLNNADRDLGEQILLNLTLNEVPLFAVDVRDKSLFVTLEYSREITSVDKITIGCKNLALIDHVVFVAVKNGHHSGKGYVAAKDFPNNIIPADPFHIKDLGRMIESFFKVNGN